MKKRRKAKSHLPSGTLIKMKNGTCLAYLSHDDSRVEFLEKTIEWKQIFKECTPHGLNALAPAALTSVSSFIRWKMIKRVSLKTKLLFLEKKDSQTMSDLASALYKTSITYEKLLELKEKHPKFAQQYGFVKCLVSKAPVEKLREYYQSKNYFIRKRCVKRCNQSDLIQFMNDRSESIRALAAKRYYKFYYETQEKKKEESDARGPGNFLFD